MAKLTKSFVERLELAQFGKTTFVFDESLKGFGLRISGNVKTYVVQSRVKGQKVRVTIGRHGVFTAEAARKEAQKLLGAMASGVNPNNEKKRSRKLAVTLRQLYDQFKEARLADGGLRPTTIYIYESALRRCFGDWLDVPAAQISRDMVVDRFRQIATSRGPRSNKDGAKAQASQAMRVLRTLLNFGALTYEDMDGRSLLPVNPVTRLSQTHRGWSRTSPRNDIIGPKELPIWYSAVSVLPNQTMKDYLLFCLFTGLRRASAAKLKWCNVNFQNRTITIPPEDDKTRKGHMLPLSEFTYDLLWRRSKARRLGNDYVFPVNDENRNDHMQEPKRAIANVVAKSGVRFSMHTLRRTFATTGERLDISYYKVKQLLNHSVSGDITGNHYIQIDIEQLREPMELITDYFRKTMKIDGNQMNSEESEHGATECAIAAGK